MQQADWENKSRTFCTSWVDDLDREHCGSFRKSPFSSFLCLLLDRDDAIDYGSERISRTQLRVRPTRLYLVWPPSRSISPKSQIRPERGRTMTPDELNNIATELKRLGAELNLSDKQKEDLKSFLTEKYEQMQEYRKQNPNVSREDLGKYIAKNRDAGREKIEKFLTPEQLKIWDAEVAKAKDFLSQRAAGAGAEPVPP